MGGETGADCPLGSVLPRYAVNQHLNFYASLISAGLFGVFAVFYGENC